jgi:phosphotriesterase-related protein
MPGWYITPMSGINTALGTISASQMGPTLMHEHTVIGYTGWDLEAAQMSFDLSELAKIVAVKLQEVSNYGIRTVVDATPDDLGRNVELNRIISNETGLNIICSTGKYMDGGAMSSVIASENVSVDMERRLYDTFMKEITIGIRDSGVRAGVIKVATGKGRIFPYEEIVLRVAARVQQETGVPIISHTQEGTMGPEQASLLLAAGADRRKVVIGHMCGNSNIDYQMAVLNQGVSVNFDRWGLDILFPDKLRKETLLEILKRGFADRVVLSHDHIAHWLIEQPDVPDFARPLIANWSYTHIFRNIVPELKQAGISDDLISQMLVENPRKIFE